LREEAVLAEIGQLQAAAISSMRARDYDSAIERGSAATAALVQSIGPPEKCTAEQLPLVQQAAVLYGELALAYNLRGDVDKSAGPMHQAIRYAQQALAFMPQPERGSACCHDLPSMTGECEHPPPHC